MKIVRGKLTADDLYPPNVRYNEVCDCVESTADGGATWTPTPSADPRHGRQFVKPPHTTGDIPCDSAANAVKWLKDFIDAMAAALTDGATAFTLANVALSFYILIFGEVGLLVKLILGLGSEVFGLGAAIFDGAFDSTVYDELLCLFLCAFAPDGTVSADAFAVMLAALDASSINATAKIVLALILNAQGENGLANAGAIGSETGDCSACPNCGWVIELDWTGGNTQGMKVFSDSSFVYGAYTGAQFRAVHTGTPQELLFYILTGGIHLTGISIFGTLYHGTGIGHFLGYYDLTTTGTPVFADFTLIVGGGIPSVTNDWLLLISPSWDLTEGLGLYFVCDGNGTGNIDIQKMRISGTGAPPPIGRLVDALIP